MTSIGDRIREKRKALGLTIGEFASKVGVHRNTQARYEAGNRSPDGDYLLALSVVGIDVQDILTGESKPPNWIPVLEKVWEVADQQLVLRILGEIDLNGLRDDVAERPSLQETAPPLFGSHRFWLESLVSRCKGLSALFEHACALDADLLARTLEAVEQAISRTGRQLSNEKRSRVVAMLYRAFSDSGKINQALIEETLSLTDKET